VLFVGFVVCVVAVYAALDTTVPHPAVTPQITNGLIDLNKALLAVGEAVAIAVAFAGAAVIVGSRYSQRIEMLLTSTNQHPRIRQVGIGLTALLIACSGESAGLAGSLAHGADQAIALLARTSGASDPSGTLFIVQQQHAIAGDHSEIPYSLYTEYRSQIVDAGGTVTPYDLFLSDIRNPSSSTNPSNSTLLLVPQANLTQAFGVTSSAADSTHMPILVTTKQLGVPTGGVALVDGARTEVVKNLSVFPGLNRSLGVASLQQMTNLITFNSTYSGLMVDGLSLSAMQKIISTDGLNPSSALTEKEFEQSYTKFWNDSVMPPQMQDLLELALTSIVGLAFIKGLDFQNRRSIIANQSLRGGSGIQPHVTGELYRAVLDLAEASLIAAPITYELVRATNGSQFGMAEAFNLSILGSGITVGAVALLLGVLANLIAIRQMNMVSEINN
jgi:hypothetical protein